MWDSLPANVRKFVINRLPAFWSLNNIKNLFRGFKELPPERFIFSMLEENIISTFERPRAAGDLIKLGIANSPRHLSAVRDYLYESIPRSEDTFLSLTREPIPLRTGWSLDFSEKLRKYFDKFRFSRYQKIKFFKSCGVVGDESGQRTIVVAISKFMRHWRKTIGL